METSREELVNEVHVMLSELQVSSETLVRRINKLMLRSDVDINTFTTLASITSVLKAGNDNVTKVKAKYEDSFNITQESKG
jgi:hypothetical protein